MVAAITFTFNIAYTLPVNSPSSSSSSSSSSNPSPKLTPQELWQGIKRGGRHPDDFAPYVHSCSVLSGGRDRFRRRLVLADGAVHTQAGETLDQDVVVAEGLYVEATTVDTGAKSTFHCSYSAATADADDAASEGGLYLTAMYELRLADVQPGSQRARDIAKEYTALARGACWSAVRDIRVWKEEGKLEVWRREDEQEEEEDQDQRVETVASGGGGGRG